MVLTDINTKFTRQILKNELSIFLSRRRGYFSEYGGGSGNNGENNSENGSEAKTDNDNDTRDDSGDDFEENEEYDFDGKMDFDGMEEYDFDGKMDFDGIEEYDFDGKMNFDGMEEYDFDGKMDFDGMEESDEENRLEPKEESDISQELDKDTNADNIDDQSSSAEQENESYENLNSKSTSTVLIYENREEEGENLQIDNQNHEEIEEINQEEFDKEIEKELEEGVEAINKYLDQEAEFINAYQNMVTEARELDAEQKSEGKETLKTEEEWEKEVKTAASTAEQLYEGLDERENESKGEILSEPNEESETDKDIHIDQDNSKEAVSELEEEKYEVGMNEIEQHQVDPLIKEALETESEPIIDEKEIEQLQELNLKEQFNDVLDKEEMEELIEWHGEQIEQEKEEEVETQTDNSEEVEFELEEGMNEIEQHQVDPMIKEALETESEPIVNEKELEKFQEMELEEQFQAIELNDLIKDLVEQQEEDKIEQEKKSIEQTQEIIHQPTYLQEKIEEQERELELEYEEKEEVDQHQVEAAIEEELETEPKHIIREEELEYVKNFEPEKQLEAELFYELIEKLKNKREEGKEEQEELSTEEKVAQIKRELGIVRESKSGDAEVENRQEEVLKHETFSPDVSEQSKKIEQEFLNEIDSEDEDSDQTAEENYENLKKLYKQQTGKRSIYAGQETKGYKQWLEQRKETEKKEKVKQNLKEEKKEKAWKRTLKNRIEEASEIEPELKSMLIKFVEKYNELENLIKKYFQLHNKAQRKKLSQIESNELNSVVEELVKLDPINIELFLSLREIKRYIENDDYYYYEYWNDQRHQKVFSHFFTQLSQRYKNLNETREKGENWEKLLKNWIYNTGENELDPNLKAELKEVLDNYNEIEAVALMFMKLYYKRKKLAKTEQKEFKSLIAKLQELDFLKIDLFTMIKAIKHYINDSNDSLNKTQLNQIFSRFFTQLSQKYKKISSGKQTFLNKKVNLSELGEIKNIETFENYGLIYLITNLINGKVYLGKTIQKLKRRMQQHLNEARHSRKQTFLVHAIKKYGKENFEVEILNFFDNKESLSQAEKYYIKKFKSNAFRYSKGYNMTDGGETFRILYGEEHPMFVNIDIESLKELIQEGFTISEIAEEFKVSITVIHNRVKEMGFVNIEDARTVLGGSDKRLKIRSSRMSQSGKGKVISDKTRAIWSEQRKGSKNPKFIKLNQNQLIQAIKECGKKKGGRFTLIDVGKELNTTKNTAMHKIKQLLGISFPEAKNQYFFAPIIKELIKNGKIAIEISNELGYTDQSWTNKKIRELWGLSLRGATRRFRAYPKINNELLISLVSENLSAKEIDEIFIKNLVLSYTLNEITKFLEIDKDSFYRLVRKIFGFKGLIEARNTLGGLEVREFFERSRREKISKANQKYNITKESIKSMIKKGLKLQEIAQILGCSKKTLHSKLKEIFNKKFSNLRDEHYWKPLLKSLLVKNLSVIKMAHELNMTPNNLGGLLRRLFGTESPSILREKKVF